MNKKPDESSSAIGCISCLVFALGIACIAYYFTGDTQTAVGYFGFAIVGPFVITLALVVIITLLALIIAGIFVVVSALIEATKDLYGKLKK